MFECRSLTFLFITNLVLVRINLINSKINLRLLQVAF